MVVSTLTITAIGVLITKLRNLKKKLDMIEVLTKAQVKFKNLSDKREANFEERFITSQDRFTKQIVDLCTKIDIQTAELEKKLDSKTETLSKKIDEHSAYTDAKITNLSEKLAEVKDEATNALIQYLRENSISRKR